MEYHQIHLLLGKRPYSIEYHHMELVIQLTIDYRRLYFDKAVEYYWEDFLYQS